MKKFVGAFLLMSFIAMASVVKADSSPFDHVQKFQFEKQDAQSFEISAAYELTAIIPDAISVIEPEYTITHIDYVFVTPVMNMPTKPHSRCNGPPAGINI